MKWHSDQITPAQLHDLRNAAEKSWADDTRAPQFVGHPCSAMGQCYVTSRWLSHRLGGHVGHKEGHYFWVSPDHSHVIDLTGDRFARPPHDPAIEGQHLDDEDEDWKLDPEQKIWRPAPVMYKRTTHPQWKGYNTVPEGHHPRADLFERRAEAALKGQRIADLLGPTPYTGETPEKNEEWDKGAPMLHDEPGFKADANEHTYDFVIANGQIHVSPHHSQDELATHAKFDLNSTGPFATGKVRVAGDNARWYVNTNMSLNRVHQILVDYSDTRGWEFDGMLRPDGSEMRDDFGARKSMWYRERDDGHLLLSERPLPHGRRIFVQGKSALVESTNDRLFEWANDFGYRLAEWPGGGNAHDQMKNREHLDLFNRGDPDWEPPRDDPDMSIDNKNLRCGDCGEKFDTLAALTLHQTDHHHVDEINEDGHFPWPHDFDDPLGFGTQPVPTETIASLVVMPLANKREARRFQRFATYNNFLDMEDDPNVRVYGAFKRGQLVGYMAVRIASPAPEPPNYRKATDEKHCGGCKMFDKGLCWGYGNRPVKEDYVCDSFAPEGKTSSIISNEPEILMIDTVKQGHGVGTALVRLAQAQYDSFFTHTDSTAGERLAKRMGMVNVNGQRWRWVKEGKDPKDMIEADIPFVYNIEGTKDHKQGMIYIGYAGQSTHDVHPPAGQRFTPGGIVEGYYQPGGKVLIVNETDTPWTIYGFANLWYALYPQMEITGIELQEDDGKTTKLAATTDIPPEPGSTPIPDGHVRLWHYTEGDPEAVRQQGLLMNRAKGENYGEPNQIWASARPPEFMTHNVVEFHVPVNDPRWNFGKYEPYINYGEGYQMPQDYGRYLHDRGAHVTFLGDIRPDEIVAVHEPWHHHYHYLMSHHGDPSGDPSQFDFLKDDRHYGPALEAWKNSLWPKTTKTAANSIGTYLRAMTAADPAASRAYQALKAAGGHVYAVGGAVRDALRGRDPKDIDLVVTGLPPEEVAFALGQLPGRIDLTGKRFGVYRYRTHGQDVEVALPREDKYDAGMRGRGEITVDHRLPIEQDLMRRDFTANSMAVDLDTGQLLDPAGGARDIEANRLKQTHADAFREDPTRLIRALTMHGHHGLIPDEDTRADMARHAHALKGESPDALNKVIDKMMTSYHPANAIRLAKDTGVLDHLFPEVADNWDFNQNNHNHAHPLGDHLVHTLDNVSQLTDDPDVRMAALYHDVGKPASEWKDENGESHYYENEFGQGAHHELVGARMAQDRLEALNYPRARINRVIDLIRGHMFPAGSSMRWARRFVNKYGDHAEDLLTLRQADVEGKGIPQDPQKTPVHTMRNLVSQVRQEQQPTALSQLAINGNDLLSMGLLPGPQIGQILQQLMNDVMETPALNNKDALLSLAARYIQNLTTNRSDTKC